MSLSDIDSTAAATSTVGALFATVSCSYAYGLAPSNTFTTSREMPRAADGFTGHTTRCVGNGGSIGPACTRLPTARCIPAKTNRANSASVIPGGDCRMLTLARPAGVMTSKSGRNARLAGEPVHAARPNSNDRHRAHAL